MEHNQVFDNYDEAHKYSLTVPWKLETCNVGERCWCRMILPTEKILYKNKVGDTERVDELDYILPDGSIDKETAEYMISIHNQLIENYKNQKMLDAVRSAQFDELNLPEITEKNKSTVKPKKLPKRNETNN